MPQTTYKPDTTDRSQETGSGDVSKSKDSTSSQTPARSRSQSSRSKSSKKTQRTSRKDPAERNQAAVQDTKEARDQRKRDRDEAKLEKAYEEMGDETQAPDVEATSKVSKAVKDQDKLAADNRDRWLEYNYTETHDAISTDNGDHQIDVHTVGGKVYLNSHGERTLDHDDLVTLRKKLDEAFQAAS